MLLRSWWSQLWKIGLWRVETNKIHSSVRRAARICFWIRNNSTGHRNSAWNQSLTAFRWPSIYYHMPNWIINSLSCELVGAQLQTCAPRRCLVLIPNCWRSSNWISLKIIHFKLIAFITLLDSFIIAAPSHEIRFLTRQGVWNELLTTLLWWFMARHLIIIGSTGRNFDWALRSGNAYLRPTSSSPNPAKATQKSCLFAFCIK